MNSDDRSTVHDDDTTSATAMTASTTGSTTMPAFDDELRLLVRFAAVITVGSEAELRRAAASVVGVAHPEWVEEVVLQSYLFAGFPRALNAAREWRRMSGRAAPASDERSRIDHVAQWQRDGEATCATVYGRFYERLRVNIRDLHPALDAWMIVEGYGNQIVVGDKSLATELLGGIPFPLLSDYWPHGAIGKAYGVFNEERGMDKRSAFLLDAQGIIRFAKVYEPGTIPESKDLLERLRQI